MALLIAAGFLVLLASPKIYKLTRFILERRKWNKSLSSDIWGFWNGIRGEWTGILIDARSTSSVRNMQSRFRRALSHCRKTPHASNAPGTTGNVRCLPTLSSTSKSFSSAEDS